MTPPADAVSGDGRAGDAPLGPIEAGTGAQRPAAHRRALADRLSLLLYAAITATAALATFLTIPILVRLLGLAGFGTWSLIEPIVYLGTALAVLGAEHGVMKQVAHDGGDVRRVVGELLPPCLVPLVVATLLAVLVALLAAGSIATALLVGAVAAVEGVLAFLMVAARASGRLVGFAVGQIGRTLLVLAGLALVLVVPRLAIDDVDEVLAVRLALVASTTVLVLGLLAPRFGWSWRRLADAVHYGSGILVTSLLSLALDVADRYAVGSMGDEAAVGAYVVHVKVAALVGQGVLMPFMLWFPTERFRHMRDADGGEAFFTTTAELFLLVLVIACGATFLAGPIVVATFAPEVTYAPGTLALVLLSMLAIGMTHPLNIGLLRPGQTHKNVYAIACGLTVLALLLLPLTALLGPLGAAAARAVGSVAFLVGIAWLSQRVDPVGFALLRMAAVVVAGMLAVAALQLALPGVGLPNVVLRTALFVALSAAIAAAWCTVGPGRAVGASVRDVAMALRPSRPSRA